MAKIRVEIDFHINGDIWIKNECLTRPVCVAADGFEGELILPPYGNIDPCLITFENYQSYVQSYSAETSIQDKPKFSLSIQQFKIVFHNEVEGIDQAEEQNSSSNGERLSHRSSKNRMGLTD